MWLLVLTLAALVVVAVPVTLYGRAQGWGAAAPAAPPTEQIGASSKLPADRFVQSIVTSDGGLGWRQ